MGGIQNNSKKSFKPFPWFRVVCLIPLLVWIFVLLVGPHVQLFVISFIKNRHPEEGFYLGNYIRFFSEPLYWRIFVRTAIYAIVTTFFTLSICYPAAFFLAKMAKGRWKLGLILLVVLPFWISELVRTYSWMIMLRETGVINWIMVSLGVFSKPIEMLYNDYAIFVGLSYASMLYMLLPIYGVLDGLDDTLIEAAQDLGASRWTILWEVVWPHSLPGVTAGCIIVFMLTLGNYLTPTLMGGKNSLYFTETIYNQFIVSWNWNQGSAFGFLLLLLSGLFVWLGLKFTGQKLTEVVR
ncbi:MAG: ABC transporter permease subunit [Proteobacteria bacterium]|nr:ABC transporter permease subunit [Pseudomonadota bacterium]NIS72332.1 ABC transporter permease subunit [Pseudomonadota bacterium]